MPVAQILYAHRIAHLLTEDIKNRLGHSLANCVAPHMLDKKNPALTAKNVTVQWVAGDRANLFDSDLDITVYGSWSEERDKNADDRQAAIARDFSMAAPSNLEVSLWLVLRHGEFGMVEGKGPALPLER